MFKRIISQLTAKSTKKRRRSDSTWGLGFEVLEDRTLLTAVPIAGAMRGAENGQAGHRRDDNRPRAAEVQAEAGRAAAPRGNQGQVGSNAPVGHRNGASNGVHSRRDRNAEARSRVNVTPPASPLPPSGSVLPAPPATPSTPVAGGTNAIPPNLVRPVDANAGLDNRLADNFDTGLQREPVAEAGFAPATTVLGDSPKFGESLLSPTKTAILPTGNESVRSFANARDIFAMIGAVDLREGKMSLIDGIAAGHHDAFLRKFAWSSTTDAVFAGHFANPGSQAESTATKEIRPFREGFVEISNSDEELLGRRSQTTHHGDCLLGDLQEDVDEDFGACDFEGDDELAAIVRILSEVDEASGNTARGSDSTAQEPTCPHAMRDGMIQLAHRDNAAGAAFQNQPGEAAAPEQFDASFLKLDGAVVQYQAFEIAPAPDTDDREALSSDDSNPKEQPSSEDISKEARGSRSRSAARATFAPVLLAFSFFGRRSRRRNTSTT